MDSDIKKKFGNRLKLLRQQNGLTQEELSEILDLSVVQVSRFECGHHFSYLMHLDNIAKAFGVEVKHLFAFKATVTKPLLTSKKIRLINIIKNTKSEKTVKLLYDICIKVSKAVKQ